VSAWSLKVMAPFGFKSLWSSLYGVLAVATSLKRSTAS